MTSAPFALLTASGLTAVQLSRVPLALGTITPANGSSSGGATLTTRGSGFQTGATAAIGGKSWAATFLDMNTPNVATPVLIAGKDRVAVTNPDGESAWLDRSLAAN